MFSLASLLIPVVLWGQVPAPGAASRRMESLRQERKEILNREVTALTLLADRLGKGKEVEANEVRALIVPPTSKDGATRITLLHEVVGAVARTGLANMPTSKQQGGNHWRTEVANLRDQSASLLFELAVKAAKASQYSLADACLRDVIARLPDHAEARRILGYVRHDGGWATPYVVRQLDRGLITHPTFGWVEATWVSHLEKGELPAPGRPRQPIKWVSAQEANAARTSFEDGWQIQTEHFLIQTNVPPASSMLKGLAAISPASAICWVENGSTSCTGL